MNDEKKLLNPSLAPGIEALEKLFDSLNRKFFNSALPKPVISLSQQGTRAAKGWCTEEKVWAAADANQDSERYYEINICPEYLNRPIEEIAEIMLHEMVHLFNIIHGIQDCSSNGQYHNKHFKESAEQHGLNVERVQNYGYAQTSLKQETVDFAELLKFTKLRRRIVWQENLLPDNILPVVIVYLAISAVSQLPSGYVTGRPDNGAVLLPAYILGLKMVIGHNTVSPFCAYADFPLGANV